MGKRVEKGRERRKKTGRLTSPSRCGPARLPARPPRKKSRKAAPREGRIARWAGLTRVRVAAGSPLTPRPYVPNPSSAFPHARSSLERLAISAAASLARSPSAAAAAAPARLVLPLSRLSSGVDWERTPWVADEA
uniref:Uncharacterized protein n=1 Tax=Oryza glumipatula TaxID=40148 RepID=A0A0D9Z944_9ORYZ